MPCRIFQKIGLFVKALSLAFIGVVCLGVQRSPAATNNAVDPGGGSVTLQASGNVTVEALPLALIKQVRHLSGDILPNNADVVSGQTIYFVLYVDNPTDAYATDIGITDLVKKSQFTYLLNSLETTVVPSGSDPTALWGSTWTPLTDRHTDSMGNPDDMASVDSSPADDLKITLGAVSGQANQTLPIHRKTLWAVRFKALVK